MTKKQFLEKMVQGGHRLYESAKDWKEYGTKIEIGEHWIKIDGVDETGHSNAQSIPFHEVILNPKAWQAVAKTEKWQSEVKNTFQPNNPLNSHSWMCFPWSPKSCSPFENSVMMMAYLFEGRSIDEFLERL